MVFELTQEGIVHILNKFVIIMKEWNRDGTFVLIEIQDRINIQINNWTDETLSTCKKYWTTETIAGTTDVI